MVAYACFPISRRGVLHTPFLNGKSIEEIMYLNELSKEQALKIFDELPKS